MSSDAGMVIRYNAGNDTNGNPRRCYVVYGLDRIKAVYDEGIYGHHCITDENHRALHVVDYVDICPQDYKGYLKLGERLCNNQ